MAESTFKVRMRGRAGLEYIEGQKMMAVDSETLVGPNFDLVIYADSIKRWAPPHDAEEISEADLERIRTNIGAALGDLRIDWQ